MSKLKNIKALQQMIDGTHRTQTRKTFGFSDTSAAAEKNKRREVGEVWSESDASGNLKWITQMNGYRVTSNVHPDVQAEIEKIRTYLSSFPNCQKESCTCLRPTSLDHKFRKLVGMCEDCLISMETKLKIQGKFNEYALDKMKANAQAFFKQADKEVEILKAAITNIHFAGDENDVNPIETWSFQDPEAYKKMIDENYIKFKEKTMEKFA